MADLSLPWGGDISLDETGDFLTVDKTDEVSERVVRRMLTNAYVAPGSAVKPTPAEYIFDRTYGGNVRSYVDTLANGEVVQAIQKRLADQVAKEVPPSAVNVPTIDVEQNKNVIIINATIPLADGSVVLIPQLEVS
jgi:hypothetical protein